MYGKSWGGFNSLQVAARRPAALKTIISADSSDDRYADDIHYRGGCVLGREMLSWAHIMFLWNARPPYPESLGPRYLFLSSLISCPGLIQKSIYDSVEIVSLRGGSLLGDLSIYSQSGVSAPYLHLNSLRARRRIRPSHCLKKTRPVLLPIGL